MKNFNFKKLMTAALSLSLAAALTACGADGAGSSSASGSSANQPYQIGVLQYGQHASLDNCYAGFAQGLEQAGLVEGVDYTIDLKNAGFDNTVDQQIAGTFSADGVDLMVGIATPSAQACFAAAEDSNIPVVFTAVTDPAAAGLDSGNITGTSDQLPVEGQLQLIRALQPTAKTIGIVYTTSEPNSVSAIAVYEELAAKYDFTIDALAVSAQEEVTQAVDTLISHRVDCLSNLTDNNVVGVLPAILEKTNGAAIPVYGSEVEQVKIGCMAGAGIDYVKLGIQTGEMAAKIIRGETTCDQLPFEIITNYDTYINSEVLDAMGFVVPADVASVAVDVDA